MDRKVCQPLPAGWEEDLNTETGRDRKKKVPVYILEFKAGVTAGSEAIQMELQEMDDFIVTETDEESGGCGSGSGSGRGAGQKRKRKEKKSGRRRYAYTMIWKQPAGAKARIMTTEEGIKAHKFLDPEKERADIGPVSFNDTVKEGKDREQEVSKFSRMLSVRTGRVGRPVVRKKSKSNM